MNLTDKMAYLRGMVDGMELDLTSTKEGKVLGQLLDVMQDLTAYVSDLQTQVDELTEVCDLFDQDLGDLEDIVYDEDDEDDAYYSCDDDDDFDDDDFDDDDDETLYETVCPSCNNVIALSESVLEEGKMPCPCCGEMLEFDYSDLDDDALIKQLKVVDDRRIWVIAEALRNKIRLLSVYTAALQICISNKPAVCRLVSFGLSEFGDVSGYGTGSGTVNEIA